MAITLQSKRQEIARSHTRQSVGWQYGPAFWRTQLLATPPRHLWRKPTCRRGSVYVAVLGVAMIVGIMGLCGMHLARLQLKGTQATNGRQEARILAISAVDHAVSMMNDNSNWRTDYVNDVEVGPYSFGDNTFSWKLVDEDGDLADDTTDPLWVYGIGRVGNAVWFSRARARIDGGLPLEFLRTAIHSSGRLSVVSTKTLVVTAAPASTDSLLQNEGMVTGDAEAVTLSGSGIVTGTTTVPADPKGMPLRTIFDDYVARATPLSYSPTITRIVLAPGLNEYDGSGLNSDGVYYINTSNNDLTLSTMRLLGTLVVDVGSGRLTIANACLMESYRDDFPVLIVKGAVDADLQGGFLAESSNFNPPGAPYLGQTDTDKTDQYPSEIRGLLHVIGNITFTSNGVYRGVCVVDGSVTVSGTPTFVHDPSLMLNPPLGYTDDPESTEMIIDAQSWTCQPAP